MINFISENDKNDPKVIWKLRPLEPEISNSLVKQYGYNGLKFATELLRFSLVGVENFKLNGKELQFFHTVRTLEGKNYLVAGNRLINAIPPVILNDLILKLADIAKTLKKDQENGS